MAVIATNKVCRKKKVECGAREGGRRQVTEYRVRTRYIFGLSESADSLLRFSRLEDGNVQHELAAPRY